MKTDLNSSKVDFSHYVSNKFYDFCFLNVSDNLLSLDIGLCIDLSHMNLCFHTNRHCKCRSNECNVVRPCLDKLWDLCIVLEDGEYTFTSHLCSSQEIEVRL